MRGSRGREESTAVSGVTGETRSDYMSRTTADACFSARLSRSGESPNMRETSRLAARKSAVELVDKAERQPLRSSSPSGNRSDGYGHCNVPPQV
jgi:hypothetical protein